MLFFHVRQPASTIAYLVFQCYFHLAEKGTIFTRVTMKHFCWPRQLQG